MEPATLLGLLGTWGHCVARGAALLLLRCEHALEGGALGVESARIPGGEASSNFLLDSTKHVARLPPGSGIVQGEVLALPFARRPATGEQLHAMESRLARLVLVAWTQTVRTGSQLRPDILKITAQFLANPEIPHTYHVSRFSLILALRAFYDIKFDNDAVEQLRSAYDRLRGRSSTPSRFRHHKRSDRFDNLLLDVLCMEGWVQRRLSPDNLAPYYQAFCELPFGITPERQRVFADRQNWPRLSGSLPEFGVVLNAVFSHPTTVPGLDFVTGGLLPAVPSSSDGCDGGLVTLIAGAPGTGKTSLCLTLAWRMAELGSMVRYITTEEDENALRSKITALTEPLPAWFCSYVEWAEPIEAPNLRFKHGLGIIDFATIGQQLRDEFLQGTRGSPANPGASPPRDAEVRRSIPLPLVFPRVVIIDSITALLQLHHDRYDSREFYPETSPPRALRRELAGVLQQLRDIGICIFLIGGEEDCRDQGLAYLVDNVLTMSIETESDSRHPVRILSIDKTRLQQSHRGRHIFHLSGDEGPSVSPSLHAVLRRLKQVGVRGSDPSRRVFLWASASDPDPQLSFTIEPTAPPVDRFSRIVSIQANAQTLIYGHGSSGKARLALTLAFEPRIAAEPRAEYLDYVHERASGAESPKWGTRLSHTRVLVISFLYGRQYYEAITARYLSLRLGRPLRETTREARSLVDVLDFYPGFIDAESVVARVRMRLRNAELDGRPYSGVIIDGVHNLLLQFPLLENEVLIWPSLYRLFRTSGLDSITTFTFFRMAQFTNLSDRALTRKVATSTFEAIIPAEALPASEQTISSSEKLFFHLLVSSCDYTFLVEPPLDTLAWPLRRLVRVKLASSIDEIGTAEREVFWDPDNFAFRTPNA